MRLSPDPDGGWQLEDKQGRLVARGMTLAVAEDVTEYLTGEGEARFTEEELESNFDDGYSDALYDLAHDLDLFRLLTPGWRALSRDERREILIAKLAVL